MTPEQMDAPCIKAFENDLALFDDDEEGLRSEYRDALSQLEEIEPWLEALTAYARVKGIDLDPVPPVNSGEAA